MFYDKVNYNEWLSYIGSCFKCTLGLYRIKLYTVIHTLSNVGRKKKMLCLHQQLVKCFTALEEVRGAPI